MINCKDRITFVKNAGVAEDTRFIDNLIGYCSWRNININELFCELCRSPGIPCQKCGGLLQSVPEKQIYHCSQCNINFTYKNISWVKFVERSNKTKKKLLSEYYKNI